MDAARARVAAESGCSETSRVGGYHLRSRAGDANALRVFGPRDGR